MAFRDRLVATIHAARSILEMPEILIIGSEVPNLLEPHAASTLVVSLDLDIGVPVHRHPAVKARLGDLLEFTSSPLPVLPVGTELDPPKLIVVVPASRIAAIASARPIVVRLSAELLSAECLALTLFETVYRR